MSCHLVFKQPIQVNYSDHYFLYPEFKSDLRHLLRTQSEADFCLEFSRYTTPAPVTGTSGISLSLAERPLDLKPIICLTMALFRNVPPSEGTLLLLYPQIHFSFPATTIFTSRGR